MDKKARFFAHFEETVQQVHRASFWLFYVGIISFFATIFVLTLKSFQLYSVLQRQELSKGNNVSNEELEQEMNILLEEYKQEKEEDSFLQRIVNDAEDKRAILMGNKETLVYVLVFCIINCILFLIQSWYMFRTTNRTLNVVTYIREGPIEEGPANLAKHGYQPQDPRRIHEKTKKFFCMAMTFFILMFLASLMRILITVNSQDRENKIYVTILERQDSSSGNLKVNARDSLAWNFVRAYKEGHHDESTINLLDIQGATDLTGSGSNNPIMWSIIYFCLLTILVYRNMRNFYNYSTYQEEMVLLLGKVPEIAQGR